jgi:hypothetical protein
MIDIGNWWAESTTNLDDGGGAVILDHHPQPPIVIPYRKSERGEAQWQHRLVPAVAPPRRELVGRLHPLVGQHDGHRGLAAANLKFTGLNQNMDQL